VKKIAIFKNDRTATARRVAVGGRGGKNRQSVSLGILDLASYR